MYRNGPSVTGVLAADPGRSPRARVRLLQKWKARPASTIPPPSQPSASVRPARRLAPSGFLKYAKPPAAPSQMTERSAPLIQNGGTTQVLLAESARLFWGKSAARFRTERRPASVCLLPTPRLFI